MSEQNDKLQGARDAESILAETDKLGILKKGTVGYGIALSAVEAALASDAEPVAWIPLTQCLPDPSKHDRVLIYTEGTDFAGEQFFDVAADSLNECFYESPEDQPEVCRAATHWMARPFPTDAAQVETEAEPVYQTLIHGGVWNDCSKEVFEIALRDGLVPARALYLAPPSTAQIEAAAIRKAAEVCDKISIDYSYVSEQANDAPDQLQCADKAYAAKECADAILALIPTEAAQVERDAKGAEEMYYLQDSRSYVGNCPLWWALEGKGYTSRLDRAQRYTLNEALQQHRARETDVPWPCSKIDALRRPTVDIQEMGSVKAQVKAIASANREGK